MDGRSGPTSGPLHTEPWVRFEIVLAMSDKVVSCACYVILIIVQYVYTSTLNVPCAMRRLYTLAQIIRTTRYLLTFPYPAHR